MSRPRMFIKGEPIRDPAEAVHAIANREWLFWHSKPIHPGWSSSWQINMLINACRAGIIFRAISNPERSAYDFRRLGLRGAK